MSGGTPFTTVISETTVLDLTTTATVTLYSLVPETVSTTGEPIVVTVSSPVATTTMNATGRSTSTRFFTSTGIRAAAATEEAQPASYSTTTIVASVVGSVIFIILCVGLLYLLCCRRRAARRPREHSPKPWDVHAFNAYSAPAPDDLESAVPLMDSAAPADGPGPSSVGPVSEKRRRLAAETAAAAVATSPPPITSPSPSPTPLPVNSSSRPRKGEPLPIPQFPPQEFGLRIAQPSLLSSRASTAPSTSTRHSAIGLEVETALAGMTSEINALRTEVLHLRMQQPDSRRHDEDDAPPPEYAPAG
ncbi:hypothetical protein MKEN_00303800 [Mycena kentingensis (nom. inval.)]|nr:hypothetical protein MKEN_00303800 [Mycena kentingensis (nom. inval.)]